MVQYSIMSTKGVKDSQPCQETAVTLPTDVEPDAEPIDHGEMMGPCLSRRMPEDNKTAKSAFKIRGSGKEKEKDPPESIKEEVNSRYAAEGKAEADMYHKHSEDSYDQIVKDVLLNDISIKLGTFESSTGQLRQEIKSLELEDRGLMQEPQPLLSPVAPTNGPAEEELELSLSDLADMPEELQMKHFDVFIITSRQDEDSGRRLKELLETITIKDINTEQEFRCQACCLESGELGWVSGKINTLCEGIKRSTFTYILVTQSFVTDAWATLQKDDVLMASVENADKRWSVVPVFTQPKRGVDSSELPPGFRSLKGLDMTRILEGKPLSDYEPFTHEELMKKDRYFLPHVQNMLGQRVGWRIKREEIQQKRKEEWISKEKQSIKKKMLMEKHQAEMKRNRELVELEEMRKHLARKASMERKQGYSRDQYRDNPGQGHTSPQSSWTPYQGYAQPTQTTVGQSQVHSQSTWTPMGQGHGHGLPGGNPPGHASAGPSGMPMYSVPYGIPPPMPFYSPYGPNPGWMPPQHTWPPPPGPTYNIYNPNMLQLGNANTLMSGQPDQNPQVDNWGQPEPREADNITRERPEEGREDIVSQRFERLDVNPIKESVLEEGNISEFPSQPSGGPPNRLRLERNIGPTENISAEDTVTNRVPSEFPTKGAGPQYTDVHANSSPTKDLDDRKEGLRADQYILSHLRTDRTETFDPDLGITIRNPPAEVTDQTVPKQPSTYWQ